jgi:hypothetical protein
MFTIDTNKQRAMKLSLAFAVLLAIAAAIMILRGGTSTVADTTPQVDAQQLASFSIVRQGSPAGDLPKATRDALDVASGRFPLAKQQVRTVKAADGTAMWVFPGEGSICLAAENREGLGMACGTTQEAVAGKVVLVERSTVGGEDVVYGLAPDQSDSVLLTSARGRSDVRPTNNVYVARSKALQSVDAIPSDNNPGVSFP